MPLTGKINSIGKGREQFTSSAVSSLLVHSSCPHRSISGKKTNANQCQQDVRGRKSTITAVARRESLRLLPVVLSRLDRGRDEPLSPPGSADGMASDRISTAAVLFAHAIDLACFRAVIVLNTLLSNRRRKARLPIGSFFFPQLKSRVKLVDQHLFEQRESGKHSIDQEREREIDSLIHFSLQRRLAHFLFESFPTRTSRCDRRRSVVPPVPSFLFVGIPTLNDSERDDRLIVD